MAEYVLEVISSFDPDVPYLSKSEVFVPCVVLQWRQLRGQAVAAVGENREVGSMEVD